LMNLDLVKNEREAAELKSPQFKTTFVGPPHPIVSPQRVPHRIENRSAGPNG
jgi:hypothetical protein